MLAFTLKIYIQVTTTATTTTATGFLKKKSQEDQKKQKRKKEEEEKEKKRNRFKIGHLNICEGKCQNQAFVACHKHAQVTLVKVH